MMAVEKIKNPKTEFQVHSFDAASHYKMICDWWKEHQWLPTELSSLPKNGVLISSEDEFLVSGFIYLSDSDIGWIEWILSNPQAPKIRTAKSMGLLIESLCSLGKENGCRMILTLNSHEALSRRLIEHGFNKGATNVMFVKEMKNYV